MSSTPILPQEILDSIIDLLWDDLESLKACSLTVRLFTLPSQRNLLSKITLTPPLQSEYLKQVPNRCQRLHNTLHESPHLASCIQHLRIVDGSSAPYKSKERDYGLFWVAEERCLGEIFNKFIYLSHIQLEAPRTNWDKMLPEVQQAFKVVLSRFTLERLEIHLFKYPLPLFLHASTSLKHLILHGQCCTDVCLPTRSNASESSPIHRPPLSSLHTDEYSLDFVDNVDWLMSPSCPLDLSSLRSLTVVTQGPIRKHRPVARLAQFARSLECFTFSPAAEVNELTPAMIGSVDSDTLTLSSLLNVREIVIRCSFSISPRFHFGSPFRWLCHFFSNASTSASGAPCSNTNLRTITIHIDAQHYRGIVQQDMWPDLDRAIALLDAPNLEKVVLKFTKLPGGLAMELAELDRLKDRLRFNMPLLDRKGVLDLTHEAGITVSGRSRRGRDRTF